MANWELNRYDSCESIAIIEFSQLLPLKFLRNRGGGFTTYAWASPYRTRPAEESAEVRDKRRHRSTTLKSALLHGPLRLTARIGLIGHRKASLIEMGTKANSQIFPANQNLLLQWARRLVVNLCRLIRISCPNGHGEQQSIMFRKQYMPLKWAREIAVEMSEKMESDPEFWAQNGHGAQVGKNGFAKCLICWRARHDSNVRLLPSEGSTLSI